MKKKIIIGLLFLFLACIGWLVWKSIKTQQHKELAADKIQQLPEFALASLNGSLFTRDSIPGNKPVVIVHFSSGCEHCEYEAKEIVKNKERFQKITILMITRDSSSATLKFVKQFGLDLVPSLVVLMDLNNQLHNIFALTGVPSFLIYNKEQKLVKKINGEVKMDYLLRYIPQ